MLRMWGNTEERWVFRWDQGEGEACVSSIHLGGCYELVIRMVRLRAESMRPPLTGVRILPPSGGDGPWWGRVKRLLVAVSMAVECRGWRQSLPCPLASAWLTWARWRRLSGRGVVCLARASGVVGLVDHHQYLSLSLYVLGDLSQPVLVVWQGRTEDLPALPAHDRGPVLTPCRRPLPMKTSMSSMSSMSIPSAASRRMGGGWWATGPASRMRETSAAFR